MSAFLVSYAALKAVAAAESARTHRDIQPAVERDVAVLRLPGAVYVAPLAAVEAVSA